MKLHNLFLVLLGVSLVQAKTFKYCDILLDGTSIQWIHEVHFQDDEEGLLLNLTTVNIEKLKYTTTLHDNKYFDVELNSETLSVSVGPSFSTMEGEKESANITDLKLLMKMSFLCKYESDYVDMLIVANVALTNNFKPEFTTKSFGYKIPLPFSSDLDLGSFATGTHGYIEAHDYDIDNRFILFKIEPDNVFDIVVHKDTGRKYFIELINYKPITVLETSSLVLTAIDQDGVESEPKIITISAIKESDWDCSCTEKNKYLPHP